MSSVPDRLPTERGAALADLPFGVLCDTLEIAYDDGRPMDADFVFELIRRALVAGADRLDCTSSNA
jgi:hypothetical protein